MLIKNLTPDKLIFVTECPDLPYRLLIPVDVESLWSRHRFGVGVAEAVCDRYGKGRAGGRGRDAEDVLGRTGHEG